VEGTERKWRERREGEKRGGNGNATRCRMTDVTLRAVEVAFKKPRFFRFF